MPAIPLVPVAKEKKSKNNLPVRTLHSLRCKACPLDSQCQKIEPTGHPDPVIYVLGEAPGKTEVRQRQQFVGESGQLLRRLLPKHFAIRFNNTLKGLAEDAHKPTDVETECCRPFIEEDIAKTRPRAIFGFGDFALRWVLGESQITEWRGVRVPVNIGGHHCYFFPMVHPAWVLRKDRQEQVISRVFEQDIEQAVAFLGLPVPEFPSIATNTEIYDGIERIPCTEEGLHRVERFLARVEEECRTVAVDVETTSLKKPYSDDEKILSLAIGHGERTVAIGWDHPAATWSETVKKKLAKVLLQWFAESKSWKYAHNLNFDLEWLAVKLGQRCLNNSRWLDTQVAAYVLDDRFTQHRKLDFLIRREFGFKLKVLSDVDVAKLVYAPLKDVLNYNALDAKWTAKLAERLEGLLRESGQEQLFREHCLTIPTLVRSQIRGLVVDTKKVQEIFDYATLAQQQAQETLFADSDVQAYIQGKRKFNHESTKDLGHFYYDYLKLPVNLTEKGNYKLDEKVLSGIKHPTGPLILKVRSMTP